MTFINFQEKWGSKALNGDPGLTSAVINYDVTSYPKLELTYAPSSPIYARIQPLISIFTVPGKFVGRALSVEESMDSSGQVSKKVTAAGLADVLHDSVQPWAEFHNTTPKDFLQTLIDRHNEQVEDYKKVRLGTITVTNSTDNVYRFTDDTVDTYQTIQDKLVSRLGGEIEVVLSNGQLVLNYVPKLGKQGQQVIALKRNLLALTETVDLSSIATVLKPLGGTLDQGTDAQSNPRLTIKEVNGGSPYLRDEGLINQFGVQIKAQTWDDVTTAAVLLTRGKDYLANQNLINNAVQLTAVDLSLIGKRVDSFVNGNEYRVVNPIMGFDRYMRVVAQSLDLLNPANSTLTMGNPQQTLEQYRLNIQRDIDNSKRLSQDLQVAQQRIKKLAEDSATNQSRIIELTETAKKIQEEIEKLKQSGSDYTAGDMTNTGYRISQDNLKLIKKYAKANNLKPSFLVAQMFVESHWGDPKTSSVGEVDNNWSGISQPFSLPADLGVQMSQGTARPEGGHYVHFKTLEDYFKAYAYVMSARNGIYVVAGKMTIDEFCKGLFKVGGAAYDYAEAGYDAYRKLLIPTYDAITVQNTNQVAQLDK